MEPIKFYFANKAYYFNDDLIFTGTKEYDLKNDEIKRNQLFIKSIRDLNSSKREKYINISDEDLIAGMIIKELPNPITFPKFDNETPFQIIFDGKIIKNPKIIAIRWNGYNWEYQLENMGHKYDYQSEDKLKF